MWKKDITARKELYESYSSYYYSESYKYINPFSWLVLLERRNLLLKLFRMSIYKNFKLLDIGCADGYFVNIAEKMGSIASIGIDISNNFMKVSRDLSRQNNLITSHFVCADAQNLPFREQIFEICILSEVIEHCPEPWKALKECWKASKNLCILSVPTGDSLPWVKIIKKIGRFTGIKKDEAGHLHELYFKEVIMKIKELDLEILDINGVVFLFWTLMAYPIGQISFFKNFLIKVLPKLVSLDLLICSKFPIAATSVFFRLKKGDASFN